MESNAVLASLQPNNLLCPGSSSSSAAAATFLPLSSSQHTRFSPPQFLKVTSLFLPSFSSSQFPYLILLFAHAFLLQLQKQVLASASCRNVNETNSPFRNAAVLSDSYRCVLFVFLTEG